MHKDERRHAHGTLIPNIYFLLQLIAVLLVLSLVIQLVDKLKLGLPVIIVSCVVSVILIMFFLLRRKRVIQRQEWYD